MDVTSTSNIPWLDTVMVHHMSRGHTVSIVGGAGTGKTTLAMQLLVAASGPEHRGLMLLGVEPPLVAAERLAAIRAVQQQRVADGRVASVDYIDILSGRDPKRTLSVLRAIKAATVVIDLPCSVDCGESFVDRCRSSVDRTTTLIFTGYCSSLWGSSVCADVALRLSERRLVNGATRVRLSYRRDRFVTLSTQLELVGHSLVQVEPLLTSERRG